MVLLVVQRLLMWIFGHTCKSCVSFHSSIGRHVNFISPNKQSPILKCCCHKMENTLKFCRRTILQTEFPETPMVFINATLDQSRHRLFPAYRVLEEAQRTFKPVNPPYNKIKHARKSQADLRDANIHAFVNTIGADPSRVEILRELQAARRIRRKAEAKLELELEAEREKKANEQRAMAEGTMQECGCCFGDYPLNRMIHCDADTLHWFCKACAKQAADTEIGNSKYILRCMSMDGCEGGFSSDQRYVLPSHDSPLPDKKDPYF